MIKNKLASLKGGNFAAFKLSGLQDFFGDQPSYSRIGTRYSTEIEKVKDCDGKVIACYSRGDFSTGSWNKEPSTDYEWGPWVSCG